MSTHPNVVPFVREPSQDEQKRPSQPEILGKLRRREFELWVCRSGDGSLSLKWWRWREDDVKFYPAGEGGLTLKKSELRPLAELLHSVADLLDRKGLE